MVPPKGGTILCGLPKGVFDFAAKLCCWLLEKPAYQNLNFDDINIIFKQCHPRPGVERDEITQPPLRGYWSKEPSVPQAKPSSYVRVVIIFSVFNALVA